MTAEEAINLIKDDFRCFGYPKLISTKKMAIEALEKQIPKVPERYIKPGVCVCPNCHGIIEAHISKTFCTYCGQSITYSESDSADE